MKKTLAFIAATAVLAAATLTPCLSSGIMASAATTNTITITQSTSDTAEHTYSAYQIFSGELKTDGTLESVQWTTSFDGLAKFIAEGSTDYQNIYSDFSDGMSAAAAAAALALYNENSAEIQEFATAVADYIEKNSISATATGTGDSNVNITGITSDGYYFIQDTTDDMTAMTNGAYTRYILLNVEASEGQEVDVKSGLPTVEKKVKENTKNVSYDADGMGSSTIVGEDYNDVADYTIGDFIEFELIGSLPENFADYDTYYYQFTDTMATGLTLKVSGGSDAIAIDTGDFVIYVGDTTNGRGTTVINSSCYTVESTSNGFTVTFNNLTDIKDIGDSSITLTKDSLIYVTYTAYLNESATIGLDGNENEVYLTYSNNPNAGGEGDKGQTPKDANIVFTYELDTTKIDGTTQDNLEGAEFVLYRGTVGSEEYAQVNSDGKITGWTTVKQDASTLTSDENGLFKVIGLDDGTYYLEETKAPTGYNLLNDPVTVVISATTANNQNWTNGTASSALTDLKVTADNESGTADVSEGTASITIENKSGSALPETGGIGTTIFYVVGGVLVVGAGVLLITKKRAKSAQ